MKIYISWSGQTSRDVAGALRELLSTVFQRARVFMLVEEIAKGSRWSMNVAAEIETTDIGIGCITKENINSPWIMFEAGALSALSKRFVPLLIDLSPVDLTGPLVAFQAFRVEKADMMRLLTDINSMFDEPLPDSVLNRLFQVLLPDFEKQVQKTIGRTSEQQETTRADRDILSEVLESVRQLKKEVEELRIRTDKDIEKTQ
jgi:hypothetical protein